MAAVLVPNVLRYITNARQSRCQSDASSVLTELQAEVAEIYATEADAITKINAITTEASKKGNTSTNEITVANAITDAITSGNDFAFKVNSADKTNKTYGTVTSFAYQDGTYYVVWTAAKGWEDVEAK